MGLNVSNNQLCGHWKTPDFSGIHMLVAAIKEHKLLTMDAVEMAEALVDMSGQSEGISPSVGETAGPSVDEARCSLGSVLVGEVDGSSANLLLLQASVGGAVGGGPRAER